MESQPLTHDELTQFTGTDNYYSHSLLRNLTYTDGVKYLAERAQAYWLIDLVASWQLEKKVRAEAFQVWTLTVTNSKAIAVCDDGNGNVVASQEIEFTDFPLDSVKLYLTGGVILLPSEY
jgi:hypothetical protein